MDREASQSLAVNRTSHVRPAGAVPRVSVVITCYNYAKYVAQAIQSALDQNVPPLEVIVVNDGSSDGSAGVLAAFGEHISVIDQDNSGQIVATNRGYAASRGEIVMFLDADDLLLPGAIEAVLAAWTPQCTKVQFELEVIDGSGNLLGRRFCNYVEPYGAPEIEAEFAAFGTYVWPVLSGNAYSRWFLERLMPLAVQRAPDGHLNTLAPLYGPVEVVARTYALYRLHNANQSYHGNASGAIGSRFSKQVSLRRAEMTALKEHARARGVVVPAGKLLDNELPFINYRLMLKKLRCPYEGSSDDSTWLLWRAGLSLLRRRPLPSRLKLAHGIWLTALLISPRFVAEPLIALRFNRAAVMESARRRLGASIGFHGGRIQNTEAAPPD